MEAVVVDAGSKLLKAGIAAPDQDPALVMPSKMKWEVEDNQLADGAVVEEVVQPVVRGFVKDWDAMEDLLNYVLYSNIGWEIGDEGQVLFTEPLFTPKALREQLVQLMFEKFNVSGFYDSEQAVLSLYAVGRISGCTVDIGHGKIDIAPVCEGAVQHIASKRFEIGGIDLTNLFAQELKKSNPLVNIDISDVERLKEQYACCTEDQLAFEAIESSCQPERHTLPDVQWESFICMLMAGVDDPKTVYEENGNEISKTIKFLSVRFASFDLTVEFFRSVFLVQQRPAPRHAPKRVKSTLRLDKLDNISRKWVNSDVLIFNHGHWCTPTKLFDM